MSSPKSLKGISKTRNYLVVTAGPTFSQLTFSACMDMPRHANHSEERPYSVTSTFFTSVWNRDNVHETFSFHLSLSFPFFFFRESVDEIVWC